MKRAARVGPEAAREATTHTGSNITTYGAGQQGSLPFLRLVPTCISLPLPPALSNEAILCEVTLIVKACWPTAQGRQFAAEMHARGYTLLSWPDGVRCAFLTQGRGVSSLIGIWDYRLARVDIEMCAESLQRFSAGGTA